MFSAPIGLLFDDIEVISLLNNFVHSKILKIHEVIPSLPGGFYWLGGTQLPNGNFLLCGENANSSEKEKCLLFKNGFNQGEKVGATKINIFCRVCMLDPRGYRWRQFIHETFPFVGGVKQKIDVPVKLFEYAIAIFDNDRMLISGGCDENVSKTIL